MCNETWKVHHRQDRVIGNKEMFSEHEKWWEKTVNSSILTLSLNKSQECPGNHEIIKSILDTYYKMEYVFINCLPNFAFNHKYLLIRISISTTNCINSSATSMDLKHCLLNIQNKHFLNMFQLHFLMTSLQH